MERIAASIGLDVGGTHILAVLMTDEGKVLHRAHRKIEATARADIKGIIAVMTGCIADMVQKGSSSLQKINFVGLGLAIPGNVDPRKGTTRYLPNFGWTEQVPIASMILENLKTNPKVTTLGATLLENLEKNGIQMRNDGRCAALAERHFGVGKDDSHYFDIFAMLTIGTGIGGALVLNGALFDGCSFDAGDFGHHVICSGEQAFDCVCGKRGCFERHASAAGLVRHYNRVNENSEVSLDDAKRVIKLVRDGDQMALKAFERYLDDLTTGLANLVTFYNPNVIVLGGGLAQAPELFSYKEVTLTQAVDSKTLPATRGKCQVIASDLGADAVAMGAAWLSLV